ncbi:DGQHR domain-containing protein [Mycoplasmatota bacterium WC30]
MKFPYMKINQKGEVFYMIRFKAKELKQKVNFHFRNPYSNEKQELLLVDDYISKLKRRGLGITSEDNGVQRRIDLTRISNIRDFINDSPDSFFPTSLILALDPLDSKSILNLNEIENDDTGHIELEDDVHFQIIDGQHRLSGLFLAKDEIQDEFELSAVLLINATTHMCAKIFSDVNGNQKPVSRSVIYDLFDLREPTSLDEKLIKDLHGISNEFNNDMDSPLFKHIKMLGVGSGAISQAFFIETVKGVMNDIKLDHTHINDMYQMLYIYFKALQRNLSEYWPVYEMKDNSTKELDRFYKYSYKVLKTNKSQLLKTNGFGAIMILFGVMYKSLKQMKYDEVSDLIKQLIGKFDWCNDPLLTGTSKKTQKQIADRLIKYLKLV